MEFADFCAEYNASNLLPPSQNQRPIFVKNEGMNFDGFIAAYQQNVINISGKPTSYIVLGPETENKSAFKACVADLHLAGNIRFKLGNYVDIPVSVLKDIIKRIVPTYDPNENCSVINTSVFTSMEVERLISSNRIISFREKDAIRRTLLHPQFPLALLAVVSQRCSGERMTPLFVQQQEALTVLDPLSPDRDCILS